MKFVSYIFASVYSAEALVSEAPYFFSKSEVPLVIAHRGAMGQFPEHSLGAYSSAYNDGVDFVELDIQITKDGQLITSHDPCLKETSNIEDHPEFADRIGNYSLPAPYGKDYINDWLIHDFTLAEIKTLRRKQRFDFRNPMLNNLFQYMTLNETIELMQTMAKDMPSRSQNRDYPIGLYIETKQYEFYLKNFGLDSAQLVHDHLAAHDLDTIEKASKTIPIIIECFEPESLKKFSTLSDLPLVLLMDAQMQDEMSLDDVAEYAHGIGPWVVTLFKNNFFGEAKDRNLQVHPWYVRDEQLDFTKDAVDENILYYDSKVDGLFTEHPHLTMQVFKDKSKNSQKSEQFLI